MVLGIYSITNKIDNKKYIGQSIDIEQRFFKHKSELRSDIHPNNHLQHSWNKYGEENFLFEIITECTIEELDELERYYINIYNTLDSKFGYNFEGGGNKNKILSEETLKKRSKSLSGRRHPFYGKFNEEAPFYGHKHSEEAKKKISDALSGQNNYNYGKPLPLNVKKKISLNKNTSSYFRVSKHHDKRYKQGFIWEYGYYENNIRKRIRRVNIENLEKEVKSRSLEWFKISNENTIQESENNSSQISKTKKEYAYVIECGFTKQGKQKYGIMFKNELIKKGTFPERLQIICAKINYNIQIPKELFYIPKPKPKPDEARIVNCGLNSSGNRKYGVSYNGKVVKTSTSLTNIQKICDKINADGIEVFYEEENFKKNHAYVRKENLKDGKELYDLMYKGKIIKRSIYKEKLEKISDEINLKGIERFYNEEKIQKSQAYIIKDGKTPQGKQQYCIMKNGKKIKASVFKDKLERICDEINIKNE